LHSVSSKHHDKLVSDCFRPLSAAGLGPRFAGGGSRRVERWLKEQAAPVLDAVRADPSPAIPAETG
jgi:hypothetical protein